MALNMIMPQETSLMDLVKGAAGIASGNPLGIISGIGALTHDDTLSAISYLGSLVKNRGSRDTTSATGYDRVARGIPDYYDATRILGASDPRMDIIPSYLFKNIWVNNNV